MWSPTRVKRAREVKYRIQATDILCSFSFFSVCIACQKFNASSKNKKTVWWSGGVRSRAFSSFIHEKVSFLSISLQLTQSNACVNSLIDFSVIFFTILWREGGIVLHDWLSGLFRFSHIPKTFIHKNLLPSTLSCFSSIFESLKTSLEKKNLFAQCFLESGKHTRKKVSFPNLSAFGWVWRPIRSFGEKKRS